jgi:hypothetical protein
MRRFDTHIHNIAMVARHLSQLRREVVFTGGAIVGLLLTDGAATDVRPTDDVDVIVAAARYSNTRFCKMTCESSISSMTWMDRIADSSCTD